MTADCSPTSGCYYEALLCMFCCYDCLTSNLENYCMHSDVKIYLVRLTWLKSRNKNMCFLDLDVCCSNIRCFCEAGRHLSFLHSKWCLCLDFQHGVRNVQCENSTEQVKLSKQRSALLKLLGVNMQDFSKKQNNALTHMTQLPWMTHLKCVMVNLSA